jgi:hypothetical protein
MTAELRDRLAQLQVRRERLFAMADRVLVAVLEQRLDSIERDIASIEEQLRVAHSMVATDVSSAAHAAVYVALQWISAYRASYVSTVSANGAFPGRFGAFPARNGHPGCPGGRHARHGAAPQVPRAVLRLALRRAERVPAGPGGPGVSGRGGGDAFNTSTIPELRFCRDCAHHRPHERTCEAGLDARDAHTARNCASFEEREVE